MTTDVAGAFPADALEANRAGVLTEAQRHSHTRTDRGRGHDLYVAIFFIIAAIVLLRARGPERSAWARPLLATGALAVAAVLVFRPKGLGRRKLEHDLRAGRVASVEGAIAKSMDWNWGALPGYRHRFLEVGGLALRVNARGFQAAPDAGFVRVYYLPSSRWVVNLERLPDRPLPREALASPTEALKTLGTAFGLHGRAAAAEARAGLQGLMGALAPEQALVSTPPPLHERDPRPLAQAILGSWHSGVLNLTFAADGTVSMSGLRGSEQRGRWWVDAVGGLHGDVAGAGESGDAWIAGETLTISTADGALTFRRA